MLVVASSPPGELSHDEMDALTDLADKVLTNIAELTLADQVGGCAALLQPLYDLIRAHVLAGERVHGDDTPVPVLAKAKTATGRAWVYVRDDRPFGGRDPPAAVFFYSRDRAGEHGAPSHRMLTLPRPLVLPLGTAVPCPTDNSDNLLRQH